MLRFIAEGRGFESLSHRQFVLCGYFLMKNIIATGILLISFCPFSVFAQSFEPFATFDGSSLNLSALKIGDKVYEDVVFSYEGDLKFAYKNFYKNKTKIAKIYFESKDVKSFSEEWPDKLLKDMNAKGVANGIIVCSLRCMPKDYSKRISKVNRLGNSITIIPFVRQTIHAVIDGIRSILILKARENKEHEIPAVMQKCYQNLNSPKFTTPIKIMVSEIKRMEDQFDSDVRSHELSMAKKKKFLSSIQKSLYDAVTSFVTIDTNIFPENLLIPQENIKKLKREEDKKNLKNITEE